MEIDNVLFFKLSDCFMNGDLLKLKSNVTPIKPKKTAAEWKERTDIVVIYIQDNKPYLLNKIVIKKLDRYENLSDEKIQRLSSK